MAGIQETGASVNGWRERHGQVMAAFLKYLNGNGGYVLKGGTALSFCYRLDRFSEDIDLDGVERTLIETVDAFCRANGYEYRTAKDTDTVQRCMLDYGNKSKPLKIEASYRRREIDKAETTVINGILVYNIDTLCVLKAYAYSNRDKIRDLYDLAFICNNYFDLLSRQTAALLRTTLEYKGLEHYDYIVQNQPDALIDPDKLAEDFLQMYDRLGLLLNEDECRVLEADYSRDEDDDEDELEP
jgi:predicted nucleotidyltransferase component of viral defense system